jgi:acetyl esterase/lipase
VPHSARFRLVALAAGLIAATLIPTAHAQAVKDRPKAKAQAKAKAAPRHAVPPTHADVPYGEHERQVLDFFQAESDGPAPLVVYIHGGGWNGGDKKSFGDLKKLLDAGVSVAAINYRLVPRARAAGVEPPVKWPLEDAARAIQFLRSKAGEWNIDKTRIAATGGSAGACSSLWLAFHDDMAKPDSPDPIARESTRLTAAAVNGAQTTLDPKITREWMPNYKYGGHAFGFEAGDGKSQFENFHEGREKVADWIREYSPLSHVTHDDPPVFLNYPSQDKPPVKGEEQKDPTHSALLGMILEEKLQAEGVEGHLAYPGAPDAEYKTPADFLIAKLKPAKP